MSVLYPAQRVFVLVRRVPGAPDREESVAVLGVYTDERQVGEKAEELDRAMSGVADGYVYYVSSALIDPRQR